MKRERNNDYTIKSFETHEINAKRIQTPNHQNNILLTFTHFRRQIDPIPISLKRAAQLNADVTRRKGPSPMVKTSLHFAASDGDAKCLSVLLAARLFDVDESDVSRERRGREG